MRRSSFWRIVVLCVILVGIGVSFGVVNSAAPLAAIPLSVPYSQDFDTLLPTGTNHPWNNDSTLAGWYTNQLTYNSGTGSALIGTLYSFGSAGSTERALGSVASGTTGFVRYGVHLQNDNGFTITQLTVAYTGEQWRDGFNTNQHRLDFAYQVGTDLNSVEGVDWIPVPTLNFIGPSAAGGAGALDGNDPANRIAISDTFPVIIQPGEEIMLRWHDTDDSGNDHGLAIDDLTITAGTGGGGGWIINEIHADPADGLPGDANGDGLRDASQDEFIELINDTGYPADIAGWRLWDGVSAKHIFPSGTFVPAGCAIVVFGGGMPTGTFGGAIVQHASSGSLDLNNGGDIIALRNGTADQIVYTYGSEGNNDQSLTRDIDITGADPLTLHTMATGSGGALFSPGTRVNGTPFGNCATSWVINEIHANPAMGLAGDANGDGIRDAIQDEFVEIVNNTGSNVDISGWMLIDGQAVRHVFPSGTVIPDQCAVVVFGGGIPVGTFGAAVWQTASSGQLNLADDGDRIVLNDGSSDLFVYSYGGEAQVGQSLVRTPDITGATPFVRHSLAPGSDGTLFSPGRQTDSTWFSSCSADFSDLFPSYGVAWHAGGTLWLGTNWTADTVHTPGHDDSSDDGVVRASGPWLANNPASVDVMVTGGSGYLAGWFDWNNNGVFEPAEKAIGQTVSTGSQSINFIVGAAFAPAVNPSLHARFRLYSSEPGVWEGVPNGSETASGWAPMGEVEDYVWLFSPTAVTYQAFVARPVRESAMWLVWLCLLVLTGLALRRQNR